MAATNRHEQTGIVKYYTTVAEMVSDTSLTLGTNCTTKGFWNENDGGAASYRIVDSAGLTTEPLNVSGLHAELIISSPNVRQFGAKSEDSSFSSSRAFQRMMDALNHIYIPDGSYFVDQTITMKGYQRIEGESNRSTVLNYTGTGVFISSTDTVDTVELYIANLTLLGTDKKGTAINIKRSAQSWQYTCFNRLDHLTVSNFEHSVVLTGPMLGEMQLNDLLIKGNSRGLYMTAINDFFISNLVSCTNDYDGINMTDCSEGRVINSKAWWNGMTDADGSYNWRLFNSSMITAYAITLQESFGTNLRISYGRSMDLNITLSAPGRSLTSTQYQQVWITQSYRSKYRFITQNNSPLDTFGVYPHNIMYLSTETYANDIEIICEKDYPIEQALKSWDINRWSLPLKNDIRILQGAEAASLSNYIVSGNDPKIAVVGGKEFVNTSDGTCIITAPKDSTAAVSFARKLPVGVRYSSNWMQLENITGEGTITASDASINVTDSVAFGFSADGETYAFSYIGAVNIAAEDTFTLTLSAGCSVRLIEVGSTPGLNCALGLPIRYWAET